jgi:hypothetical protein
MTIPGWIAILAALFLSAETPPVPYAAPGAGQGNPSPPAARSPLARGPETDLNIVFSAQVIGWIEPCG